ncbi:MAG: SpoIIE family protein phosphatase [Anaerolineales bacterium]|nr:SpoIIE family protein phosphatase [Anaerolineales bacterium]MCA9978784.1 SpoIIE family protein phosphatase [Anaerolineales bacterium]
MTVYIAHLLIVDTDKARQVALISQLEHLGYAVQTTSHAQRVLLLRAFNPFDLLILHIDVAAENDFELLKRLQYDSELNRLPVILLGTAVDVARMSQAMPYGITDYLIIPNEAALIDLRIKANLEKKRYREQAAWYLREFNEMEKLADDLRLKILPLGIALSVEKDFDRLLEQIVEEAMAICRADAGALYLRTENEHLRFVIVRIESLALTYGGPQEHPRIPYAPIPIYDSNGAPNRHNVAAHVTVEGTTINIADVYHEAAFDFSGIISFDQRNNYRSVSCLTVPLKNHETIGVLQLLNARDENGQIIPFDVYHQLVAESLASQATVVLHNHILSQRHEELLGFQREMEIARELQEGFLPTFLPEVDGWEIAARIQPAQIVSGDFYDAFTMPDGKIALVLADVCDKGVAAALFMALVRSLLRAFITQHHYLEAQRLLSTAASPEIRPFQTKDNIALLNAVILTNDYIGRYHDKSNMFATLFFGVLDPENASLTYVNAGHNPPLLFNASGSCTQLQPTGPAVGLRTGIYFQAHTIQINANDILLAYTDGVTDARNPLKQAFSEQRLQLILKEHNGSAAMLLDNISDAVHTHIDGAGQFDDITLLAIKRLH